MKYGGHLVVGDALEFKEHVQAVFLLSVHILILYQSILHRVRQLSVVTDCAKLTSRRLQRLPCRQTIAVVCALFTVPVKVVK